VLRTKKSFFGTPTTAALVGALFGALSCLVVAAMASVGSSRPAEALPPPGGPHSVTNPFVYKVQDVFSTEPGQLKVMARCDDGYDAIGGGFDRPYFNEGMVTTSRPSVPGMDGGRQGEGWVVVSKRLNNIGSKGQLVFAYVVCAPKKEVPDPGVYLAEEKVRIAPNQGPPIRTLTPRCRRDDLAVGGGYDFFGEMDVGLVRSQHNPGDNLHSWLLTAYNNAYFAGKDVKAYAVCVPKEYLRGLHVREAANTAPNKPGINIADATTPKCPDNTYLLGGGAGMSDNDGRNIGKPGLPYVLRIAPQMSKPGIVPESWSAQATALNNPKITIHAFAMCGELSSQQQGAPQDGNDGLGGDGGGDEGGAFAQLGSVIQCEEDPCLATEEHDVLSERVGDGAKDTMIAQDGYDLLQAQSNTNDPDVANGGSGHDVLLLNDGDAKDEAVGAAGTDVCVVDASIEASGSCEAVIDR
jgi:hypothetical protein